MMTSINPGLRLADILADRSNETIITQGNLEGRSLFSKYGFVLGNNVDFKGMSNKVDSILALFNAKLGGVENEVDFISGGRVNINGISNTAKTAIADQGDARINGYNNTVNSISSTVDVHINGSAHQVVGTVNENGEYVPGMVLAADDVNVRADISNIGGIDAGDNIRVSGNDNYIGVADAEGQINLSGDGNLLHYVNAADELNITGEGNSIIGAPAEHGEYIPGAAISGGDLNITGNGTVVDSIYAANEVNVQGDDIALGAVFGNNVTLKGNGEPSLLATQKGDVEVADVLQAAEVSAVNEVNIEGNHVGVGNVTAGQKATISGQSHTIGDLTSAGINIGGSDNLVDSVIVNEEANIFGDNNIIRSISQAPVQEPIETTETQTADTVETEPQGIALNIAGNNNSADFVNFTDQGQDTVNLDGNDTSVRILSTNGGDDQLNISGNNTSIDTLTTGQGNDELVFDGKNINASLVNTDEGDDTINVKLNDNNLLNIDGGNGNDTLNFEGSIFEWTMARNEENGVLSFTHANNGSVINILDIEEVKFDDANVVLSEDL